MNIAIGSDHAGFGLKEEMKDFLDNAGYDVLDVGTYGPESADYPDFAHSCAAAVESGNAAVGIVICGSGNGVAITANKHPKVRCALCWNAEIAALAKAHNDANMIALPARFISMDESKRIISAFLNTSFEGGRHQKRVNKIDCN